MKNQVCVSLTAAYLLYFIMYIKFILSYHGPNLFNLWITSLIFLHTHYNLKKVNNKNKMLAYVREYWPLYELMCMQISVILITNLPCYFQEW